MSEAEIMAWIEGVTAGIASTGAGPIAAGAGMALILERIVQAGVTAHQDITGKPYDPALLPAFIPVVVPPPK